MQIIKIDKDSPQDLQTSILAKLQNLLADLECYYPFFSKWLEKVFKELSISYTRKVLLCINNGVFDIVGVAIIKDTPQEKKICTLRVLKHYKNQGVGSCLLARTQQELSDSRPLITVSGVQMPTFAHFLKKRGFEVKDKIKSIYRKGAYEYFFNHAYEHKVALLSIKPEYAMAIERGEKLIEFRKRPVAHSVTKVYVYASFPVKKIIGSFDVKGIKCDTVQQLWERYSHIGCIAKNKYDEYFAGKQKAYGILVGSYEKMIPYKDPKEFDNKFRAPQSFLYLDNVEFLDWLEK